VQYVTPDNFVELDVETGDHECIVPRR
jgi:hypothetical protein